MGGGEKKIIFVYDRGRVENNRYSLIKRYGNRSVTCSTSVEKNYSL